jgi:hypothetical protein
VFHLLVKSGAYHISCDKIEDTVINSRILVTCYEIDSCNPCSGTSVGKTVQSVQFFKCGYRTLRCDVN